jgi:hypothetical protein
MLASGGGVFAATAPVAVSPGRSDAIVPIASRCPTFSWSEVEGATGYELVVVRIGEEGEPGPPVLEHQLHGAVYSWTPSLDGCLERGVGYGWSVRAVGLEGATEWSEPALFGVAAGPSQAELEEALLLVRQHLEAEAVGGERPSAPGARLPPGGPSTGRQSAVTAGAGKVPVWRAEATALAGAPAPTAPSASGVAALTVEGEVRTVDSSDAPRLWGRGRPGTDVYLRSEGGACVNGGVSFGLSEVAVDWGSAASACPAGDWVCTRAERGDAACDTMRFDETNSDGADCFGDSLEFEPDDHWGWVADSGGTELGKLVEETGGSYTSVLRTCTVLPVWCCWKTWVSPE